MTGFILSSAGGVGRASLLRTDVGVICRVAEDRDHREAVFVLWTGARLILQRAGDWIYPVIRY